MRVAIFDIQQTLKLPTPASVPEHSRGSKVSLAEARSFLQMIGLRVTPSMVKELQDFVEETHFSILGATEHDMQRIKGLLVLRNRARNKLDEKSQGTE